MNRFALAYLAIVVVLSFLTFVLYGFDKRRAQTDGRRIRENSLHLMALLGGWPGAWMGQQFFRHKTQKLAFRIVFWLCVMLNLVVVGGVVYLFQSQG